MWAIHERGGGGGGTQGSVTYSISKIFIQVNI